MAMIGLFHARSARAVTFSAALSLLLVGLPATAANANAAPQPDLGKPVPGRSAATIDRVAAAASSKTASVSESALPAPANFSLKTPQTQQHHVAAIRRQGNDVAVVSGDWRTLGSSGIAVAPAQKPKLTDRRLPESRSAGQPVAGVNVAIIGGATAHKYGVNGLVLRLARTDNGTAAAPLAIRVPKDILSGLYGSDFSSRLHWVQIDGAKPKSTPSKTLKSATAVPASVDSSTGALLMAPMIGSTPVLLAATAGAVSTAGTGSFAATPLKPSSSWDVSAQTGDFSWSYPMRIPPAAAGPSPAVAFTYDSQSVDGETGSTNNQPSAIGEGWSLSGSGFIERTYVSCATDDGTSGAVTTSGDLCWKTDNATISFGGHSGQLVKDSTSGAWKLQSDDGTRFQHLVGTSAGCAANGTYDTDCWRMTTTDGTQYYFGLNHLPGWSSGKAATNSAWTVPVFGNDAGEPCHTSTFAASSCAQAWRWNLDYVVDTHGNAEAFYYDAQTNSYARNRSTVTNYVRGGVLDHIEYGFTTGNAYAANAASGKVVFGYDAYGRCSDASHANCTTEPLSGNATAAAHPTSYPDVPFDQNCAAVCTGLLSPTFWTTAMLSTVTTKVLQSGSYSNVDVWKLGHSFPSPGDGTNAALWLTQIAHTGYSAGASLTEPPTVFSGVTMQNRVWVIDGLAPLDKYRISSIQSPTGAVTSVNYSAQQCTPASAANIEANPQSNTALCFPQWWTPQVTPPQAAQKDLFHKYVVTSVLTDPRTGGGTDAVQETDYHYTGTPAWRYDDSPLIPADKRTWSVFAGYNTVEIRVGDPSTPANQKTTDYTFYQGMDGDRASATGGTKSVSVTGFPGVPDSRWFAGHTRDVKVLNGVGGTVASDTVTTPWASAVTANNGTVTARMTGDSIVTESQPASTGGNRTVQTTTSYDPTYGLPTQVSVAHSDGASTCTQTTYSTANKSAWIIGAVAEVKSVGVDCASIATAEYPADAISDTRTSYDDHAVGAAPTTGAATKTEIVDGYTDAGPNWVASVQTKYDTMGRPTQLTDIAGHTTTTAYTPAAGAAAGSGATTSVKVTNTDPFNWTTTTTFDPAWGAELSSTDQNGKVTTAAYDALGRRVSVWLPNRPQAANPTSPSTSYAYTLSQTAASAVATTTQTAGGPVTSYALYDGLGQQVQSQSPAVGGGTVVSDTAYDSHGRVAFTDSPYWTTSADPSAALFVPASLSEIGSQTVTNYDALDRTVSTVTNSYAAERFRTTNTYTGADRVDVTPPAGGTPTSTFTNSLGQKTKLVQYLAATPDGSATTEATTYAYNVQGKMSAMTDPAGNAWSWGFDVLGHQVTATDPDTGTTTSTYDDAGNQLTSTDARGVTLSYTYDELNRKTAEYQGTTSGAKLASWTYDTVAKGQPTASTSYVGSTPGTPGSPYSSTVTGYDDLYDPTGTTVSLPADAPGFGATTLTTSATYKVDGKIATEKLPAMGGLPSETMRYGYDTLANVHKLSGTKTYGTVTYTAIGQVAQLNRELSAELYTTFGYDPATGAVNEIEDTAVTTGPYTVEADRHYTRNDAGDVTGIATTGAAGVDTQCFSYDYLNDLTQAWTPADNSCAAAPSATNIGGAAPYWTGYTIDPATGNRNQVVHNPTTAGGPTVTDTYGYPSAGNAQPHAVQNVSHTDGNATDGYTYDAAGNTITRPGQTLTYNATGKASTITVGGVTQQNIYDASGALLLQSDPTGGATLFLGQTQLHMSAGSSTASAVRTYTIDGTPVAERSTTDGTTGSTLAWISGDANHTQDLQVDSTTGTIIRRFADPYGNSRGPAANWTSDHGYLNAPTNESTGLSQLGARAYDSTLGRFLSVDSILAPGNPQQNNGYAYSANNPITNADPSGACWVGSSDSFNFHTTCSSGAKSSTGAPVITYGNVAAHGPDHGHVQDLSFGTVIFGGNPFCSLACSIRNHKPNTSTAPPPALTYSNSPGAHADELAEKDSLIPIVPADEQTAKDMDELLISFCMADGGATCFLDGLGSALLPRAARLGELDGVAGDAGAQLDVQLGRHIVKSMARRGWTRQSIQELVNSPSRTVVTRDTRWQSDGARNDAPATAYIDRSGGYVVRNDRTGDIVQISDLNDPNWKSPW